MLKVAYISCFSSTKSSLSEYSLCFAQVLGEIDGVSLLKVDLSDWHLRSGRQMYREVKNCFKHFVEQKGPIDCFHFELVNHHLMVWAAIIAKDELGIDGKVFATLHDPPLPVNGALSLTLPESKIMHRLARLADIVAPRWVFRKFESVVDGAFFLSKAGEKSFAKKWPAMKTAVIPHVPFELPTHLQNEWRLNPLREKTKNKRIEVFFAGFWWKHKGIEELIKAVSLLADEGEELRLVLSGKGPDSYVKKIERLLKKLKNQGVEVQQPGHLELADLYQRGHQADCWVVPYHRSNKVSASGVLVRGGISQARMIVSDLPQLRETAEYFKSNVGYYRVGDVRSLKKAIKSIIIMKQTNKAFDTRLYLASKDKCERDVANAVRLMLEFE
ncbi:MAG: glycosyltransferase [Verrucomicrobiae bacterium]|nr:glycosyltransferase [Verrucomicrobiae bacterium]NNJ42522.1 glycosyltransferase [Akkermansiaceae bacterium]